MRQKSAGGAGWEKVSGGSTSPEPAIPCFLQRVPCQGIAGKRAFIEEFVGDVVHRGHVAIRLRRRPIEQLDDTVEKLQYYSTLASNNTYWHKVST